VSIDLVDGGIDGGIARMRIFVQYNNTQFSTRVTGEFFNTIVWLKKCYEYL